MITDKALQRLCEELCKTMNVIDAKIVADAIQAYVREVMYDHERDYEHECWN